MSSTITVLITISLILTLIVLHKPLSKKLYEFYQNPQNTRDAMIEITKINFKEEDKLIKELTPYYNLIVKNEAGKKTEQPGSDTSKYEDEVRKSIAISNPNVIPLYNLNKILEVIQSLNHLPTEAQLYLSYMFLPQNVNNYLSTTQYLYDNGSKYYETLSTLGGPNKSKQYDVKGATPTSLGISGPEPENFTDCCNKPTINDIGGDFKLQVDKIQKTPLNDSIIEQLYNTSNDRIKLLNSINNLKQLLEKTRSVFNKLNSLVNSVNSSGSSNATNTGYAKLVSGESLDKALEGFTNSEQYSFLIRPRA